MRQEESAVDQNDFQARAGEKRGTLETEDESDEASFCWPR